MFKFPFPTVKKTTKFKRNGKRYEHYEVMWTEDMMEPEQQKANWSGKAR